MTPPPRKKSGPHNEGKVTLKTIAEHLGLTPGTVSAALNNSPAARSIPQQTKNRIIEAARALNYRPNFFARTLRLKRTYTIGVIAEEIGDLIEGRPSNELVAHFRGGEANPRDYDFDRHQYKVIIVFERPRYSIVERSDEVTEARGKPGGGPADHLAEVAQTMTFGTVVFEDHLTLALVAILFG